MEGREVHCFRKGRNYKWFARYIDDFIEDLAETRRNIVLEGLPLAFAPSVAHSCDVIVGGANLKFAYRHELPHLIWQCDDPAKARLFITKYREQVDAGQTPHRVSDLFAAPCTDSFVSLLPDFEIHAAGGPMSEDLRTAITSYQLGKCDESGAEGIHSRISLLADMKTNSSTKYWGAFIRFDQTMALVDEYFANGRIQEFEVAYRNFKVLAQLDRGKYRKCIPRRMRTSDFFELVYRTGKTAEQSFATLGKAVGRVTALLKSKPLAIADELRCDFLVRKGG
jgi:hypothetical protein